jgi:hypothetical protein
MTSVGFIRKTSAAVVFVAILCAPALLTRSDSAAGVSSARPQTASSPSAVSAASSPDSRTLKARVRRVLSAPPVRKKLTPDLVGKPRNGLLGTDLRFFPITVWLQEPLGTASAYRAIGINVFSGLHGRGPTNDRMAAVKAARMSVLLGADHQQIGLASRHRDRIGAWLQRDEPDNAQPAPAGGWGPCVEPSVIVNEYRRFKRSAPGRPVVVNFGPGAAFTTWWGRGPCTGKVGMYAQYAKGADILSFDIYPTNNGWPLTYVADGVDNLMRVAKGRKPVWAFVETTKYDASNPGGPTPAQTRAQVWLALTHGATGIQYFAHVFSPRFVEAGLLEDPAMRRLVGATNRQIRRLAPILNSPTLRNGVRVNASARIDTIAKRRGAFTYVFAVAPQASGGTATFTVARFNNGTVTVIDENRTLQLRDGRFRDRFVGYGVHLYKVVGAR